MDKQAKKVLMIFIFAALVIPVILNLILMQDFPTTAKDLGNQEWLSFWGSFLGGVLGGAATLFAIYLTLKSNIDNHNEQINLQNELKRIDVIPYLNIRESQTNNDDFKKTFHYPSGYVFVDVSKNDSVVYSNTTTDAQKNNLYKEITNYGGITREYYDTYIICSLMIKNIGQGPAVDISTTLMDENQNKIGKGSFIPAYNLNSNDDNELHIVLFNSLELGGYMFKFLMSDITGSNVYEQEIEIGILIDIESIKRKLVISNISKPELVKNKNKIEEYKLRINNSLS